MSWFDPAIGLDDMPEDKNESLTKEQVEKDSKKLQEEIDKAIRGS